MALAGGWFLDPPPWRQVHASFLDACLGLAACLPLLAGMVAMTRWAWGPSARLNDLVRRQIVPLFASCQIWQIATIALLAGIGEEALFRGVVQAGMQQYFGSPALAIVTASILFGLAHAITPMYAVLAGVIGAYLGWLASATGNLLPPIVTHAAYDYLAILYLLGRYSHDLEDLPMLADDAQ